MSDVQWVLIAFDRQTERMVKEVSLSGFDIGDLRRLFDLAADDPIIGATFPVPAEKLAAIAKYAAEPIDANVGDWFAEAQAATTTRS